MGVIIIVPPPYVDPANPTPSELAAQNLYQEKMQVVRNIISPDITIRFTDAQIPDAVISESGYLRLHEHDVMQESGYDVAAIQALPANSEILASLVFAVELKLAIQFLPQAAQMIREGLLGESRQFQEIDWELREAKLEADYKDAIRVVNPDAIFDSRGGDLDDFAVLTTKSRALPSYSGDDY